MNRRERLLARQLPTVVVPVDSGGDEPEQMLFRALPAAKGQDLIEAHPPAEGSADAFHRPTFLPALLAACEVPPDGEPALSAADWDDLAGLMPVGEWIRITDAVLDLNDRSPGADLGKD